MYYSSSSSSNCLTKEDMIKYCRRKHTIFNKARELSTLCNIDILLILYGPDKPNIPQVWCSKPDCNTVLDRYYGKKVDYRVQGGKKEALRVGGDGNFIGNLGLEGLKNLNDVLAGKIDHVQQRINLLKVGPSCSNLMNDDYFGLGLDDLYDRGQLGFNCEKTNNMIKVDPRYKCNSGVSHGNCLGEVDWAKFSKLGNYGNNENLMNYGQSYCHGDLGFEGIRNNSDRVNYYPNDVGFTGINQFQVGPSFNSNNGYGDVGFEGFTKVHVGPSLNYNNYSKVNYCDSVNQMSFNSNVCVNADYSNQMSSSSFDELGCVVNNQMSSSLQHVNDNKQKKNCSNNDLTLEDKVDGFEFIDQRSSSPNNCDDTELMLDISDLDDFKFSAGDLEFFRQVMSE